MTETATPAINSDAEAMAKFLSFLSHDLRGGLNGAVLMLEVIRRQLAKDPAMIETIGDLEMVRRSILETVSMMDRFIFAERLRLGRVPVIVTGVDMTNLLRQLAKDSQVFASERGTAVEIECETGLIVQSDENLLRRLISNLLDNAIKFGRRKPVLIRALSGGASSTFSARIEVVDLGAGIASEKLSHLFAPFEVSEPYGQKGGGIGLYVAKRVAKLLGASLRGESTSGQGTTVICELPQLMTGVIR